MGIPVTDMDTATRVTDTGIIRMDTTKRIRLMATTQAPHTTGTTGVGFTGTTAVIITGMGTKLTQDYKSTKAGLEAILSQLFLTS